MLRKIKCFLGDHFWKADGERPTCKYCGATHYMTWEAIERSHQLFEEISKARAEINRIDREEFRNYRK